MTTKRLVRGLARGVLAGMVGYTSIVLIPDSLPWLAEAALDILAIALAGFILVVPLPGRADEAET